MRDLPPDPPAAAKTPLPHKLLDSSALYCIYDYNVSKLYKLIEASEWDKVVDRATARPQEVRTWVIRKEEENLDQIRWKMLPLHVAILFRAPAYVLRALLFPGAATQVDDQDMLPLHLAFRHNPDEEILKMIIQQFPRGVLVLDRKGRRPIEVTQQHVTFSVSFVHFYSESVLLVSALNKHNQKNNYYYNNNNNSNNNSIITTTTNNSVTPSEKQRIHENQTLEIVKAKYEQKIATMKAEYENRVQPEQHPYQQQQQQQNDLVENKRQRQRQPRMMSSSLPFGSIFKAVQTELMETNEELKRVLQGEAV